MKVAAVKFVQGRNYEKDVDGTKFAIAIHNTSNTASAADEASYATRRTDSVSAHFYADATEVIQSLDTSVVAWHSGSYAGNQDAISVEIVGLNSWTREKWLASVAWDKLGAVLAAVCAAYDIPIRQCTVAEMIANPKVKGFYSHDEMRLAFGSTTHTDPGPNFPWDHLLAMVASNGDDMPDAKALLASDVVTNRPWRADVKTNPTVAWQYAVGDTWDRAYRAEQNALAAQKAASDALAAVKALGGPPAITDAQVASLGTQIAASIGKVVADELAKRLAA